MRNMQSIYPDCVSSDPSKGVKSLEIPIEFGGERTVLIVDNETMGSTSLTEDHQTARPGPQRLTLSSLPPVLLQFILPETYPMSKPPTIMSLHVTNSWFARANQLQKMLEEMWQPGEGVLYTWVEWLRNADFLGALDLLSEDGTGSETVRCVTLPETIAQRQLLTIHAQAFSSCAPPPRHSSYQQRCPVQILTIRSNILYMLHLYIFAEGRSMLTVRLWSRFLSVLP